MEKINGEIVEEKSIGEGCKKAVKKADVKKKKVAKVLKFAKKVVSKKAPSKLKVAKEL